MEQILECYQLWKDMLKVHGIESDNPILTINQLENEFHQLYFKFLALNVMDPYNVIYGYKALNSMIYKYRLSMRPQQLQAPAFTPYTSSILNRDIENVLRVRRRL